MAVKKTATKKEEVKIEEEVLESPVDTTEVTESPVEEVKVEEPTIEVKPEMAEEMKPNKSNVRIRAKVDHHCYIGGEHYNLTEGQCYNVPPNVKDILNRAGLLAPL